MRVIAVTLLVLVALAAKTHAVEWHYSQAGTSIGPIIADENDFLADIASQGINFSRQDFSGVSSASSFDITGSCAATNVAVSGPGSVSISSSNTVGGGAHLSFGTSSPSSGAVTTTITFNPPVRAWSARLGGHAQGTSTVDYDVKCAGGAIASETVNFDPNQNQGTRFSYVGWVSPVDETDMLCESITFTTRGDDAFGLDDLIVGCGGSPLPARDEECVALMLATDMSGSVGSTNYRNIVRSTGDTIANEDIVPRGGEAHIGGVIFSADSVDLLPLTPITESNVDSVADTFRNAPYAGSITCISCAIARSAALLSRSRCQTRLIDVATDGEPVSVDNDRYLAAVSDNVNTGSAVTRMNCLAVNSGSDDASVLCQNIQRGPESFSVKAETFADFRDSIERKIEIELDPVVDGCTKIAYQFPCDNIPTLSSSGKCVCIEWKSAADGGLPCPPQN